MITAVTGSADGHELVLTPTGSGWRATLPPDLTDGQYVVTLTAVNDAGNTTDYRGVLYLCAGICKLALQPNALKLLTMPREVEAAILLPPLFSVRLTSEARLDVALCWTGFSIQFVRHWRC